MFPAPVQERTNRRVGSTTTCKDLMCFNFGLYTACRCACTQRYTGEIHSSEHCVQASEHCIDINLNIACKHLKRKLLCAYRCKNIHIQTNTHITYTSPSPPSHTHTHMHTHASHARTARALAPAFPSQRYTHGPLCLQKHNTLLMSHEY